MALDFTDIESWSTEQLVEVANRANKEVNRRRIIENAKEQAEKNTIEYSEAIGRRTGDAWDQPTGAHDAYPLNFQVSHGGKLWVNIIPTNVWEPGTTGWREVATDENGVPEWIQPLGAHDAYQTGDEVSYEGVVYVSTADMNVDNPTGNTWTMKYPVILDWEQPSGSWDAYRTGSLVRFDGKVYETTVDYNVWEPGVHGWTVVEEVPEVEIDPEEPTPVDPEGEDPAPEEPSVPEFVKPTGGHDAYSVGDRVMFEGAVWESTADNNVYSPTEYAQNWTLIG